MSKCALITGITGQDGSYLAEYLLDQGYEVHGLMRRVALENQESRAGRIRHIAARLRLHSATLENYPSVFQVLSKQRFDECYHLGAQSYVTDSFADSFTTMNVNINGTHYLLEGLRQLQPACRFYFAGSSEMFGKAHESPQRETTPFHPRSPYGISKTTGYYLTQNYREAYGMFCCSGILFNHESPRRGFEFVTRKITNAAVRIKLGLEKELRLGNLEASRDWGHAADYVRAMHAMLQQSKPDDFVVATGQTYRVRDLCELAFGELGLDYHDYVRTDPGLNRPADVELLLGDASKAKNQLGWSPRYSFKELVKEMVQADLERNRELQRAAD